MRVVDSRRLTGTNLQSAGPCAVAEVRFEAGEDPDQAIAAWQAEIQSLLPRFAFGLSEPFERRYAGGACIGFEAPIDALYSATEINEYAIARAAGAATTDPTEAIERLGRAVADEANEPAVLLQAAAAERGCPFLWDDDEVSLGFGCHAQVWPAQAVPLVEAIDWPQSGSIPVAMITGTNGKTTTSRMLTRILKTAGFSVGSTSTDGVCVNEEIVESGDWTGTGAARMVLRRQDITAAVLETARGGLLRRGLAVERCDVAVVTNVAADHLGEYGIDDVAAMAEVKSLICAAVDGEGQRVINADDPHLMALVDRYATPLILFSLDDDHAAVLAHCAKGGEAWFLRKGALIHAQSGDEVEVLGAEQIPCTFAAAARHNISNALAAAAAAHALGVNYDAIANALQGFGADPADNPGRCQLIEFNGLRMMLDFGHNPHGLEAILGLAKSLVQQHPGARLCVSLGQAGDRLDQEIHALADTLSAMAPDHAILREMPGYERGRAYREVVHLLANRLTNGGLAADQVVVVDGEIEALEAAVAWANPGDLIMLLVHVEREAVSQWIAARQRMPSAS